MPMAGGGATKCKAVKFAFLVFASFLILTAGVSCVMAVGHDEGALIGFVDQNAPPGCQILSNQISSKFDIGDRVRTTVKLWVHSDPKKLDKIWLAPKESTGLIIDGPQSSGGYTWWKIRYDVGIEGWSAEGEPGLYYLEKYMPLYTIADSFQYPLKEEWTVSRDFGVWIGNPWNGYHLGEDVPVSAYTPVYATANGIVRYTNTNISGYGSVIIIEHRLPNNSYVCSLYGHLSRSKGLKVDVGDFVSKGQLIGYYRK